MEQQKVESLYKKYKEQQNDVFTAERLIAKNDIKLNTNDFPIINKSNLMSEIEKVKKMLMSKIKTGQAPKGGHSSYLSKRSQNAGKINVKGAANLICKSCKMMLNSKQESKPYITFPNRRQVRRRRNGRQHQQDDRADPNQEAQRAKSHARARPEIKRRPNLKK